MRDILLNRNRPVSLLLALAIALAISLTFTRVTSAELGDNNDGTTVKIYEGTSGPYTVNVYQSPPGAVVGSIGFVVEPTLTATGEPVTNAIVRVFADPSDKGAKQYSPALNAPVNPAIYISQLELDYPGTWTITVEIDSDAGLATVLAEADIRGRARSGGNTWVGTAMFILISAGFVGGGLWLWYSSKKARARKAAMIAAGRQPRSVG